MTDAARLPPLMTPAQIEHFVAMTNKVADAADLSRLCEAATRECGLDHFALLDDVPYAAPPPDAVLYTNYPTGWQEVFFERRYDRHDPVMATCRRSFSPFTWSQLPDLISLSGVQKEILHQSQREGLGDGFTVPLPGTKSLRAVACFASRTGKPVPERPRWALLAMALSAYAAADRLRQAAGAGAAGLTPRQADVVALIARGKTDWECARILGLSEHTVHRHVENAKARLDVQTRPHLVAKALIHGHIAPSDVIG
ncbi:autoinducer binding domain-containing protein [Parvularcula dongshanensis]|uniref:autoinducer binding domain-containing protein n=1 Tax=Parvularcula dongshanensis TaxID=1173995 RepID=UPI00160BBF04